MSSPDSAGRVQVRVPPLWMPLEYPPAAAHTWSPTRASARGALSSGSLVSAPVASWIRETLPPKALLTHTSPPVATTFVGPSPTTTRETTEVAREILETDWESSLATQMSVGVTAIPDGPASTRNSCVIVPFFVSSWLTEPLRPLDTHRVVPSSASPSGPLPTGTALSTRRVLGSMCCTALSPLLATHTPSGPATTAAGSMPTSILSTTVLLSMLIRVSVESPATTHTSAPYAATAWGSWPTPPTVWTTRCVSGSIRTTCP